MIWRRLKKSTEEEDQQFSERMRELKSSPKDMLAMIFSAFVVIVLPCLLVLLAFAFLIMLLFGAI
ncbi:MAG: hypothetical protein IKC59_07460 [Clostridia bacterium]|nr:hypothetical protein [Clostridia bacterium]